MIARRFRQGAFKATRDYQGTTGELLRALAPEPANIEARRLLVFAWLAPLR